MTSPDANLRAMIRERRPDLTDADLDTLLAPVNEAGAALAGRETPRLDDRAFALAAENGYTREEWDDPENVNMRADYFYAAEKGRETPPFVTPCHCGEGKDVPWNDHDWNCPWFITEGTTPGRETTAMTCVLCEREAVWFDGMAAVFLCAVHALLGWETTCRGWGESGVESQEVCPACGHYGLFHGLTPCNACSDEQGQRIADAVQAEGRETTCGHKHRCACGSHLSPLKHTDPNYSRQGFCNRLCARCDSLDAQEAERGY